MIMNLLRGLGNFLTRMFQNKELEYLKELHQESLRQAETQIGFLRSQIEYLQQTNGDLLRVMHTNAGLIQTPVTTEARPSFEPLRSTPGGWAGARQGLEKKYAKDVEKDQEEKNAYWKEEAAKGENIIAQSAVIVGDYKPS